MNYLHHPLQGMPWEVSLLAGRHPGDVATPSSICPIHAAQGGALPTSGGMESDSLETMQGTGQLEYSVLDLWQCLSEVAMTLCQPSASGRRMMTKGAGQEIHSENSSAMCAWRVSVVSCFSPQWPYSS